MTVSLSITNCLRTYRTIRMDASMLRLIPLSSLLALLMGTSFSAMAQDAATIQKKLVSDYALTQPTAAFDDIVTAGLVLFLPKGPFIVVAAASSVNPYPTTYKNGKMQNGMAKAKSWRDKLSAVPGISSVPGVSQSGGGP